MYRGENGCNCLLPGVETQRSETLERQGWVSVRCFYLLAVCTESHCSVTKPLCDVSLESTHFRLSLWPHGEGICNNPNIDRTVFVDLQKILARTPLGCDHISLNTMTSVCACCSPSLNKPGDQIHLFRPRFSKALKYRLQLSPFPSACRCAQSEACALS